MNALWLLIYATIVTTSSIMRRNERKKEQQTLMDWRQKTSQRIAEIEKQLEKKRA